MKRTAKYLGGFVVFIILPVFIFCGAALITARIKGDIVQPVASSAHSSEQQTIQIYLLTGLLHTDIAVPISPELLSRFSYLSQTRLPLEHSDLRHLSFGWGSEAFYTTAGSYSDIEPSAVFTAITGDRSVMRIVALGHLKPTENVIPLSLSPEQFERLISFVENSFQRDEAGKRIYMNSETLEQGDAFFRAVGNFNIFYPCNQWVNSALQSSGVTIGIWTPTTQSLKQSLGYFASSTDQL